MKKAFIAACLIAFVAGPLLAQPRPLRQQQLRPRGAARDGAPARGGQTAILDMVEGFYVSQLPAMAELSDEQFVKILPVLRQALRERFDISNRRTAAMNQLRQLLERGGSDEEVLPLVREMDKADADVQISREKFLTAVDPLLTPLQQARLRMSLINIDQRVGNMIQRAINANANRARPPAPDPPNF
jgi:hypothetical protein